MHLPRHTIESHASAPLFTHASFSSATSSAAHNSKLSQPSIVSCATSNGFLVAQTDPLKLVARKTWPLAQGGLSRAIPVEDTSLLILVGGGRVPKFAPNKVVLWDEAANSFVPPVSSSKGKAVEHICDTNALSRSSHSTLFSAGSEFEAYGREPAHVSTSKVDASDARIQRDESRSPSPADSLRFSRSSLVDREDDFDAINASSSSEVGMSLGASSIGIGRMHAMPNPAAHGLEQSTFTESGSPELDLAESSFSISASSANLDDPFASDEPATSVFAEVESNLKPIPQDLSHSAFVRSHIEPPQAVRDSLQRLPSMPPIIQRSVSSLASIDTQSTTRLPQRAPNGREVAELEFNEIVRGVHVRSLNGASGTAAIIMVVVLSTKAVIFELNHMKSETLLELRDTSWSITKRASVQTYKNPKGLGAIAPCQSSSSAKRDNAVIVIVPGKQKGHVQILRVKPLGRKLLSASIGAATIIVAHKSSLAAMALSPDGRMLATASSKGTLVRVWSTNMSSAPPPSSQTFSAHGTNVSQPGRTGFGATLIRELRRGTDPASILSIAFAPNDSAVAVASDKGTIHIFGLSETSSPSISPPTQSHSEARSSASIGSSASRSASGSSNYLPSVLSNLAGQIPPSMLPQYFSSEWSTAQFRIPLKSFSSNSRRAGAGEYGSSPAVAGAFDAPFGTEKSTEGAWAQMRGRVGDVRKGEAGVDETIFLCWIVETVAPTPSSTTPNTNQRSASGSSRNKASDVHHNPVVSDAGQSTDQRLRLLAVTTSGGWYKIALDLPESSHETSTVLNMYRNDAGETSKPRSDKIGFGCHLVEYRPILASLDGWFI